MRTAARDGDGDVLVRVMHEGMEAAGHQEASVLEAVHSLRGAEHVVVRLLDTVEDEDGRFCLVMQAPGVPVASARVDVRLVAMRLFAALAVLDRLQIIHGRIGLAAVTVCGDSVQLGDFSAAVSVASARREFTQRLSIRAPEVVLGLDPTTRVDVWSAGCLLYHLATGQALFTSRTTVERLAELDRGRVSDQISEHVADADLAQLIRHCLRTDAARRISPRAALEHSYFDVMFPFAAVFARREAILPAGAMTEAGRRLRGRGIAGVLVERAATHENVHVGATRQRVEEKAVCEDDGECEVIFIRDPAAGPSTCG